MVPGIKPVFFLSFLPSSQLFTPSRCEDCFIRIEQEKEEYMILKSYAFSCWGVNRAHRKIILYLSFPCLVEQSVTMKRRMSKREELKAVKQQRKQAARQRLAIGSVNNCPI